MDKNSLRKKAEKILEQKGAISSNLYNKSLEELVQELQIYQIELEYQNDELRRTQEKLEISKDHYKDLYENSPNGYITLSEDFKVLQLNNTLAKLLKKDKKLVIGHNFTKFVQPQDQDIFYLHINNLILSEKEQTTNLWLNVNNFSHFVKINSKVKIVNNKKIIRSSIIDITSEKLNEEKFKNLFNLSPNIVIIHSLDNKILEINKEAFLKLGYNLNDIQSMEMKDIFIDFPFGKIMSKKDKLENEQIKFEAKIKSKLGQIYDVEILSKIVNYENSKALLAHIIDITERKNFEKKIIIEKEKAIDANNLKSAFLANTSHEIRTPLNSILGFSSLLKKQIKDNVKANEYVKIINSSGQHLLNIINDIIDLSKMEANQIKIVKEDFDLNDELKKLFLIHSNSKKIRQKPYVKLKLINELEHLTINSDPNRLRQIIENLLTNAIKHTEKGTITFGYTLLPNNLLEIFVEDTGKGIPNDKFGYIFEPFGKLDNTEGTGLGLPIVKKLTNLLDGELSIKSEVNIGTKICITINANIKSKKNNNKTKETITMNDLSFLSGKNILIAEDDVFSQMLFSELFDIQGLNIKILKDGLEVIEDLKNNSYDLIILDVDMPELNGLDTSKKIREMNIKTPILIQTAFAIHVSKSQSINAGANDYITKPIESEELYSKVEKLLQ